MKENLEPISTPKELLWRDFRVDYLPWIVLILLIVITWIFWSKTGVAPTLMAEAEIVKAQLVAPGNGIVQQVIAERFSQVKAGDPLIVFKLTDPNNALNSIRMELDLLSAKAEKSQSSISTRRAEADYYSLKLDLLAKKIDLEQAKVELTRTEKDLARATELVKDKYISDEFYDISLAAHDNAQAAVSNLQEMLPLLSENVEKLRLSIEKDATDIDTHYSQLEKELDSLQTKLDNIAGPETPIILSAPIDGIISGVWCTPGETVADGQIMAMVNASESTRLIGYLRQPFSVDPTPGMQATIVTHTSRRTLATTEVEYVGNFMEPITNSLARVSTSQLVDMGMPISFKIPEGVKIRPGEVVGIMLRK